MELFVTDSGNDGNNNTNTMNRLKSNLIERTTHSGIEMASNSHRNGLSLHTQLTTIEEDRNNTTDSVTIDVFVTEVELSKKIKMTISKCE